MWYKGLIAFLYYGSSEVHNGRRQWWECVIQQAMECDQKNIAETFDRNSNSQNYQQDDLEESGSQGKNNICKKHEILLTCNINIFLNR